MSFCPRWLELGQHWRLILSLHVVALHDNGLSLSLLISSLVVSSRRRSCYVPKHYLQQQYSSSRSLHPWFCGEGHDHQRGRACSIHSSSSNPYETATDRASCLASHELEVSWESAESSLIREPNGLAGMSAIQDANCFSFVNRQIPCAICSERSAAVYSIEGNPPLCAGCDRRFYSKGKEERLASQERKVAVDHEAIYSHVSQAAFRFMQWCQLSKGNWPLLPKIGIRGWSQSSYPHCKSLYIVIEPLPANLELVLVLLRSRYRGTRI